MRRDLPEATGQNERMERTVRLLVLAAAIAALLPGCYAARLNREALHPRDAFVLIPEDLGLVAETFVVPVDGAELHAFAFPAADAKATVLVCGGNTDNKQLYLPLARRLVDAGYSVVLWDYRGFGFSTGDPDLWSLVSDGRAMLAAVRARADVGRVGLVGISLGSVVALGVAGEEPEHVDALVIEGLVNPRQKLDSMVGSFLGAIGSFLVMPGDWDVEDEVAAIPRPVLFVHGTKDFVTPLRDAEPMFDAARAAPAPRELWIAEGAGHAPGIAGEYGEEYAARITGFLDRYLAGAVAPVEGGPPGTDAYRQSRRAFERARSEAFKDLALWNLLLLREQGYDIGIEVTPEEVLPGAKKAKARLEAALRAGIDPLVAPAWMPTWDRLARAFELAGEPEEAIAAWETMLSLLPADPFAWWWFENADWELGAPVGLAVRALSRMVELTDDPARREEYVRRGTEWRRRQTERDRRLSEWAERQRSYLSSSPSSSSP